MSKIITSPSTQWSGSVTIADPLTMLHVEAIENALEIREEITAETRVYMTVLDKPKLPAILLCAETWNLDNFPEKATMENFPLSPRKASHELIEWLWLEILKIYTGELTIPNE